MLHSTVRSATKKCFQRYLDFILDTDIRALCEKGIKEIDNLPIDKLSRWLGFIQGYVVFTKQTTVQTEREFSRNLFHEAYTNESIPIPSSINVSKRI